MRLTRLAVFAAAGYVLGSKAGRERYDQIREAAATASRRLEAYGNGGRFASTGRAGDTQAGAGA
jgi:hypothetical protein